MIAEAGCDATGLDMAEMENVPNWVGLVKKALDKNRRLPYARYFYLATVREDGKPANRTVVFRGFLSDSKTSLKFITDTRSEKMDQVKHNEWVEACWYFPETREQFRILGVVRAVLASETDERLQKHRIDQWKSISDNARSTFTCPHPGMPRDVDNNEKDRPANGGETLDAEHPVDNFALMIIDPDRVDYLCLRGDPQFRAIHERNQDGSWDKSEVNA
mmetsp:Transcript_5783/g.17262  ORF Transcript_5783/g.17262 Transcript_5783/m.17262 type:complete len:218 (+) Transcript_5783:137-790(+)